MERRDFINLGLAGVAASAVAPGLVIAKEQKNIAGGVFYTEENPGRWEKKVGGHLPSIAIEKKAGKVNVQVTTAHGMEGYKHYIVKHVLLDQNYNFLAEKMFDPMKDAPISSFEIGDYQGQIYALSMCNKHDVWLSSAKV